MPLKAYHDTLLHFKEENRLRSIPGDADADNIDLLSTIISDSAPRRNYTVRNFSTASATPN